ncbi:TMAO reductase system periplasmic protein TorT [Ferrimonas pelagia]|uniref:TMAO reductase system periplasmic protein TorT n=1 Tax=Ferrimonas pelagia TaxID=1177826 RepID=UPI0031EB2CF5
MIPTSFYQATTLALILLSSSSAAASERWPAQTWQPGQDKPASASQWQPLARLDDTEAHYRLCALYPHLKDSYWLSIHAGMLEQAQAMGVALISMDAGGYQQLDTQLDQLAECERLQADAILLGSVSYRLSEPVKAAARQRPVLAIVNEVEPGVVRSTIGVPWLAMGQNLARQLNQIAAQPLQVLLMLGPVTRGGNAFLSRGLKSDLQPNVTVIDALSGENSLAIQRRLLRQYLAAHPAPDVIVCGAVCAEMAMAELETRGLSVPILSSYFSHAVYQGLKQQRLIMANSDQMKLQGRMAVDLALRALQGETLPAALGPEILTVTPATLTELGEETLSAADFRAQYRWQPE